jgi:hypothetical protein
MFNLFKSKKSQAATIEAIHNEFNSTGQRLLDEAKEIVAQSKVINEKKISKLGEFGFRATKEVEDASKIIHQRERKLKLSNALEHFRVHFPQYKFITPDAALAICEKYNLVIGDVDRFKGFVPEKNLNQIERFFEVENEANTFYYRRYRSGWHQYEVNEKEYKTHASKKDDFEYSYYKMRRGLLIAAPISQMNTKNAKLVNRILVNEVPDPVVMTEVSHGDVKLYCIITAWGDEASDEIVVNQQMN